MKNLSQKDLAKATGLSERTIRDLERDGKSVGRLKQIARLCLTLDCSIEDLIEMEEESELPKEIAA